MCASGERTLLLCTRRVLFAKVSECSVQRQNSFNLVKNHINLTLGQNERPCFSCLVGEWEGVITRCTSTMIITSPPHADDALTPHWRRRVCVCHLPTASVLFGSNAARVKLVKVWLTLTHFPFHCLSMFELLSYTTTVTLSVASDAQPCQKRWPSLSARCPVTVIATSTLFDCRFQLSADPNRSKRPNPSSYVANGKIRLKILNFFYSLTLAGT